MHKKTNFKRSYCSNIRGLVEGKASKGDQIYVRVGEQLPEDNKRKDFTVMTGTMKGL